MIAPPAFARLTSLSVMPPTAGRDHDDLDLLGRQLGERGLERLGGALNVRLEDDLELLGARSRTSRSIMLSSEMRRRRRELALAELLAAVLDDLLGDLVVLGGVHLIAGVGHAVEAEDLDRRRRTGLFERRRRDRRASRGPCRTCGRRRATSPTLQRAFLDEDGRHRAAVAVEARLDHEAGGRLVRVRRAARAPRP